MNKKLYNASKRKIDKSSNKNFHLHSHDSYEILLFIQGDSNYVVEGNTYSLEPGDVMIIRKNEMHRIYHNSETIYERFIIMIEPDFFKIHNCKELEEEFLKKTDGTRNKIDAELCVSSGLYDAFLRLQKYSNSFKDMYTPIADASITEILYLINNIKLFSKDDTKDSQLKSIISYINNKYTKEISLDEIAEHFFISKHHLCRIFKQGTGITVHSYITNKRLMRVKELKSEGYNIGEASVISGFGNYSSFYRAYLKAYGYAPSDKKAETTKKLV